MRYEETNSRTQKDVGRPYARASTRTLLSDLAGQSRELLRKELLLARSELRADLRQEVRSASGLGVAGVLALVGLTLLFVALTLLIATWLPGWLSALIVAGFVFLVGAIVGLIGWQSRVQKPLRRTQRSVGSLLEETGWTSRE